MHHRRFCILLGTTQLLAACSTAYECVGYMEPIEPDEVTVAGSAMELLAEVEGSYQAVDGIGRAATTATVHVSADVQEATLSASECTSHSTLARQGLVGFAVHIIMPASVVVQDSNGLSFVARGEAVRTAFVGEGRTQAMVQASELVKYRVPDATADEWSAAVLWTTDPNTVGFDGVRFGELSNDGWSNVQLDAGWVR